MNKCINHIESTVFENHRKSRIQHCERSELSLHFEWTLIGQKMMENAKINEKLNATFLAIFIHCVLTHLFLSR